MSGHSVRETLLGSLRKVAPRVSILKLGGLAKQLEGVLQRAIEGVSLSQSDSTFQFLLLKSSCWLEEQRNRGLDTENNQKSLVSDLKVCLQQWLQDDDSASQTSDRSRDQTLKADVHQTISKLPTSPGTSSLLQSPHLAKEEFFEVDGKSLVESKTDSCRPTVVKNFSKLQGVIVRVRADAVLVKPTAKDVDDDAARFGEVTISKRNLNIGDFDTKLSAGDTVSFKLSERNHKFGYAADLVRIKKMDPREVERFVSLFRERSMNNSREALLFVSSCRAVWTYICDMPRHERPVVECILGIVSDVCAKQTVSCAEARLIRFLKTLADSVFSATVIQRYTKYHVTSPHSNEALLVRTFILAIARYVPERSPRVLPLLQKLTSLVHDKLPVLLPETDSHKTADFGTFIMDVFRRLVVAIPGATEDLANLSWDQLPLVPTTSEMLNDNCDDLRLVPSVLVGEKYKSEDDYLDTYFRLLRTDCFYNLKTGVRKFVGGELDHRDMSVYRINLDGVQMTSNGIALCIRFKLLGNKKVNWKYSNMLMFGNLVCLAINGTFTKPIWGMIVHRTPELLEQGIVFISLNSEYNRQADAEVLLALQSCRVAIMAESPTYYRAYGPVLRCLQEKRDGVPFREELVYLSAGDPPPYLDNALVDWSLIFNERDLQVHCQGLQNSSYVYSGSDSDSDSRSDSDSNSDSEAGLTYHWPVSYFEELLRRRVNTTLDETQLRSIQAFLENRVTLIQGPPGTGKSYIGVKIAQLVLSMPRRPSGPILVLTYKNHSLDQFLQDCLQFCSKVVRVGGRSTNEALQEKNIHHLRKSKMIPDDLASQIREAKRELDNLKGTFPSAIKNLRLSRVFDVHKFVEVATTSQISGLCDSCPKEIVNSVEKRMNKTRDIIKKIKDEKFTTNQVLESKVVLSTMLLAWAPKGDFFSSLLSSQTREVPSNILVQAKAKDSLASSGADGEGDEEDSEKVYEERMLSQDVASLKDRHWRDPKQGFVDMTVHAEHTGAMFSLTVPDLPDVADYGVLANENNLWELTMEQRAHLILFWMARLEGTDARSEVVNIVDKQRQISGELNELEAEVSARVISNSSIVGMTTTGAAIHAALINIISPKVIIVEEAAEILEAQLLAVLPVSAQHLIMIGDHQQLRPRVQCDTLRRYHKMDVSMFERLISSKNLPSTQLGYQCRMREEFVELIRPLYPRLRTHHTLVRNNTVPSCIASSMFFWTHTVPEKESEHSRSWHNLHEVEKMMQVVQWLLRYNYEPTKITILTSYNGQLIEIRTRLRYLKIEGVVTSTIDRYQGDENDVVLVSLVRTSKLGFLSEPNRMCVAASRARCGVYFFGNATLFGSSCCWKELVSHFRTKKLCSVSFPLVCPVHVDNQIRNEGCQVACKVRRPCGHSCEAICHGFTAHPKCKKTINFKFPCGHASSRECHQDEKDLYCSQIVNDLHESCGHTFTRLCFRSPSEFQCELSCERRMACGHPCPLKCFRDCSAAVRDCKSCAKERKIDGERQQETNRLKLEILRHETEQSLKKLKQTLRPTSITPITRANVDAYAEIQHQVSQFLPAVGRKSVVVAAINEIDNTKILEKWLNARLVINDCGSIIYRFKHVAAARAKDIARAGLEAYDGEEWNFSMPSSVSLSELQTDSRMILIRFAVLQDRNREEASTVNYKQAEKVTEYDTVYVSSPYQARPDYVVQCVVRGRQYSDHGELGMTLKKGYFDHRVLTPSQSIRPGSDRLDNLLFREAESQFLRMLPRGIKAKVVQVEYVDNGDLNIQYNEKKKYLMSRGGDCKEFFVFHGTDDRAVSKIIREGFRIGGEGITVRHGARYGKGIYTVEDPAVAMNYAQSGGTSRVILCRTICNRRGEDYNLGGRPDVFVIRSKEQIVPQYVVHYQILKHQQVT